MCVPVYICVCVCVSHFVAFVASVVFFSSLPFAASAAAACVAFAPLGVDIERRPASLVVTPIVQSEADALSSTVQCPRQRQRGKVDKAGAWHSGRQSLIFNVQSHFTKLTRDAFSFRKGSGDVRKRGRERGREKQWRDSEG